MSDLNVSTSDFRSSTQESRRNANRKHKWHLGATERVGRGGGNPRPQRSSETAYNMRRREAKGAVASLAHGAKVARKHDMLEGSAAATTATTASDDSSGSGSDLDDVVPASAPPADAGVMYSFDAPRGPSGGSEILNVALAKAVEVFEEKETARLVKDEYDFVESDDEESVDLVPVKKGKGKGKGKAKAEPLPILDDDEDYEFV